MGWIEDEPGDDERGDGLDAARGLALGLVLSVIFWITLITARYLITH